MSRALFALLPAVLLVGACQDAPTDPRSIRPSEAFSHVAKDGKRLEVRKEKAGVEFRFYDPQGNLETTAQMRGNSGKISYRGPDGKLVKVRVQDGVGTMMADSARASFPYPAASRSALATPSMSTALYECTYCEPLWDEAMWALADYVAAIIAASMACGAAFGSSLLNPYADLACAAAIPPLMVQYARWVYAMEKHADCERMHCYNRSVGSTEAIRVGRVEAYPVRRHA